MGEPCLCGADDCSRCHPDTYRQARAEAHHDLFHEVFVPDCSYCHRDRVQKILDRCDRMRIRAGKGPLPEDMRRKAALR